MTWKLIGSGIIAIILLVLPGCFIGPLLGGMAQNAEYQKLLEVLPEYQGLEGKSVAVLVNTDMATLYENPQLPRQIAGGLSLRIARYVPNVRITNPDGVLAWQFNTAQWSALPYGDIAEQLGVDRIVYVEIYEYRIHPPGNRLMMEGVCAATIGIIERDSIDPDNFAQAMDITTMFPEDQHVTIDEIAPDQMRFTLTSLFIRDTAWLFHRHIEPKYPDKYQGSIPETFPGSNQG